MAVSGWVFWAHHDFLTSAMNFLDCVPVEPTNGQSVTNYSISWQSLRLQTVPGNGACLRRCPSEGQCLRARALGRLLYSKFSTPAPTRATCSNGQRQRRRPRRHRDRPTFPVTCLIFIQALPHNATHYLHVLLYFLLFGLAWFIGCLNSGLTYRCIWFCMDAGLSPSSMRAAFSC